MPSRSLFSFFSGSPDARTTALQNLLIAAIVVTALWAGFDVLLPLAFAALLAFVLTPPLIALRRLHVPRALGVALLVTTAFALIAGLGWLMSQQVTELARDLPAYETTLSNKITSVRRSTTNSILLRRMAGLVHRLQADLAPGDDDNTAAADQTPHPRPVPVKVTGARSNILDLYQDIVGTLLPPLAIVCIVFIFLIFILMQREDLRDRAIRLLGTSDLQRSTAAMNDAARRLSRYFLRQTLLNTLYGIFIAFGLWMIGLPTPVVWGALATIMRFVPYFGSYIAAAFPLLLAAAVEPGWHMFLLTLALYLISEPIMGQLIEPLVYGRGTGLSPTAVVVSTIFWTWLWGPAGLILATPITLCLMVLGRHVDGLHFFEVLLGDEPPLSPAQSFYQRALTGDAAEATYQAELCLKDQSLQSYLDEVAMKALELAETDAERGTLEAGEIERIGGTVQEVIDNLAHFAPRRWFSQFRRASADSHADDEAEESGLAQLLAFEESDEAPSGVAVVDSDSLPADWRIDAPVLCIGGRNALDAAAACMLAELLNKRGLGAKSLGPEAIRSDHLASLAQASAKIVCLSYVGLGGSPAHIRYLNMRLRHILPKGCIILVGNWLRDADDGATSEFRAAAGADAYVNSLGEAVEFCVAAAKKAAGGDGAAQAGRAGPKPAPAAGEREKAGAKLKPKQLA
jgi:predicted PurR-regulated permease PerM